MEILGGRLKELSPFYMFSLYLTLISSLPLLRLTEITFLLICVSL